MRKPACLPEQLLCSWHGASPAARSRVALGARRRAPAARSAGRARRGRGRPASARPAHVHRRARGARRRRARAARTTRPSAAPLSTSGSACSILQDDRGRITASGSPQAATIAPVASQTTAWPRWCDSATFAAPDLDHRSPRQPSSNPSARSSPSIACRWRKASRIRDFTVPSGRPSRRGDLAVAEPLVEGGDEHPPLLGRRARRAPPRSRASRSAALEQPEPVGRRVGLEQRIGGSGAARGRRGGTASMRRLRAMAKIQVEGAGARGIEARRIAPDRDHHVLGDLVGVGGPGAARASRRP